MSAYKLAVDIGGTFTDVVAVNVESGEMITGKTLTSTENPAKAVIEGLADIAKVHRIQEPGGWAEYCIHATTLVANSLVERKGAVTGLITTSGMRDILEIGREQRYDIYDMFQEMPRPLVRRRLRIDVDERMGLGGVAWKKPETKSIAQAARTLVDMGARAIAIVFLHSYENPAHEKLAEETIRQLSPDVFVSPSYKVAPEYREYERTSTTVANAYVGPIASKYLIELEDKLHRTGVRGALILMTSAGGVAPLVVGYEAPITLIESGPAAGALAGGFFGSLAGARDIIAFDMGGTTAKACLVEGGAPLVTHSFEAARVQRFKKGSGLPLRIPSVELIEIGAGGGSIARVDRMGLLKVGPESSGANPGPACYGLGGEEGTVTDADLLLGYLDPNYFAGGEMKLDMVAAKEAMSRSVSKPLGIGLTEACWGVYDIVTENMASAARVHIAERGRDPRKFVLVATGGAGPIHAYRLARKVGLRRVVCPLGSGVASAIGMLVARPQVNLVRAHISRLADVRWDGKNGVNSLFDEMKNEAEQLLGLLGVDPAQASYVHSGDFRYCGQGSELVTRLPIDPPYGNASVEALRAAFEELYLNLFGHTVSDADVEAVNWRLTALGPAMEAERVKSALMKGGKTTRSSGTKGRRPAYFPEAGGYVDTAVYDRYELKQGDTIPGPAIVEERDSTIVVGPNCEAHIDQYRNLVMDVL